MHTRHVVRRAADANFVVPGGWAAGASGYRRWSAVDEDCGAVHTGFRVNELDPGGTVPAHLHSFEESFYVVAGSGIVDTPDGAYRVGPGDYGLLPIGVPHAWRNDSGAVVRWAEMQAPVPRQRFDEDTVLAPALPDREPSTLDVRDMRLRRFGNITPQHMEVGQQSQDMLAVSASMRTALLVYGGITVKMMVDSDLGARLSTMFMVKYDPEGAAGQHDHPLEETYFIQEGATDAYFDGEVYRLEVGDIAWAGVGCVHGFRNASDPPVRWLETQAPQPPSRYSYRFARDWDYIQQALNPNGDDSE
jgi:quercetin dioxygenase-like cupin family protein